MLIKYMGSADIKIMDKGESFAGRLATPLDRRVEWNWQNRHIVDTSAGEYSEVSDDFWQLLLQEPNMMDVTDEEVVPLNAAQRLWQGLREPGDPVPPGLENPPNAQTVQAVVTSPVHPPPPEDH